MASPYIEEAARRAAAVPSHTHTPGPWHVNGIHIGDAQGIIIGYVGRHGGPENAANARLIASAPDMLAALQAMVTQIEHVYPQASTLSYGRAAIAKASQP